MALRNQPYFPMYVQDFLTDEKLTECSALATGVCIKIMCLMHKSEMYGKIELKEKDKQNPTAVSNFAKKLSKSLPWTVNVIEEGIDELVSEGVMQIDGDFLIQKRMVKDNETSLTKSKAGKQGAKIRYNSTNLSTQQ